MVRARKQLTPVELMADYARQLERHRQDRIGLHIRISALERQFHQSYYKQKVAFALRHILEKFSDAHMYSLPNADVVMILHNVTPDDIEPSLMQIRRDLKDSSLIASLDPVSGVSDRFVAWYPLERDYRPFMELVESFERGEAPAAPAAAPVAAASPAAKPASSAAAPAAPGRMSERPGIRKVVIQRTDAGKKSNKKPLDADALRQLTDALRTADVSAFIRRQKVVAMVRKGAGAPVFSCRFVPLGVVGEALLPDLDLDANLWLRGYLQEFLADRMLAAKPNVNDSGALATSIQMSVEAVLGESFDEFDASLGGIQRSNIIAEISFADMLEDSLRFQDARNKLEARGYRICLSDVEIFAFLKMRPQSIDTDFVKIRLRDNLALRDLDGSERRRMIDMVDKIGRERVILDSVNSDDVLSDGLSLNISLFQGTAVAPVTRSD